MEKNTWLSKYKDDLKFVVIYFLITATFLGVGTLLSHVAYINSPNGNGLSDGAGMFCGLGTIFGILFSLLGFILGLVGVIFTGGFLFIFIVNTVNSLITWALRSKVSLSDEDIKLSGKWSIGGICLSTCMVGYVLYFGVIQYYFTGNISSFIFGSCICWTVYLIIFLPRFIADFVRWRKFTKRK